MKELSKCVETEKNTTNKHKINKVMQCLLRKYLDYVEYKNNWTTGLPEELSAMQIMS